MSAAWRAGQRAAGRTAVTLWLDEAERALLEAALQRHRAAAALAEPEPPDPRQLDIEDAISCGSSSPGRGAGRHHDVKA